MGSSSSRAPTIAVLVLLAVSLLGNAFQAMWANAEDTVRILSRPELEARAAALRETHGGSSSWLRPWVDESDLVVLEAGNMVNFRGLFGNHAQREILIWKKGN